MVPFLTIHVRDHRHVNSPEETPQMSDPIQIPYLSPIVLRKELESILEREGDTCLGDDNFVDDHHNIYWNLIWFFERIGVNSHLPGLALRSARYVFTNSNFWSQAFFYQIINDFLQLNSMTNNNGSYLN